MSTDGDRAKQLVEAAERLPPCLGHVRLDDDPLARQSDVEERAGKAARAGGRGDVRQKRIDPMSRPHKPSLDEMGPHSERVVPRKRRR